MGIIEIYIFSMYIYDSPFIILIVVFKWEELNVAPMYVERSQWKEVRLGKLLKLVSLGKGRELG